MWALCEAFLTHVERRVFPGGGFFEAAIAEFDSWPGPVRDAVVDRKRRWSASLALAIREAQATGRFDPRADPEQLAWELNCLLMGANGTHAVDGEPVAFDPARRPIRDRLDRVATAHRR